MVSQVVNKLIKLLLWKRNLRRVASSPTLPSARAAGGFEWRKASRREQVISN